ncbi:hypothetical protein GCM10010977_02570 [Citricoccus zhacaiensis]|uniref:Head-tail adaptor protein n=1 Tax=Citricoccus zhacaiensis TaxID=489142 RepID=A0ABQ2LMN0_9MICC|nr:head-tail adaptor protein [Citricoccus zhacaiensis]GGO40368.1 hypothetical protein GCM10010977_02570 [Citricoccus zhacaiensis]
MILHDRIETVQRIETGDWDDYGNPIVDEVRVPTRAALQPMDSDEMTAADPGAQVVTRYRLILPASSKITARDAIHHGGRTYEVHGDIAPHTIRGRVHHHEAVIVRTMG